MSENAFVHRDTFKLMCDQRIGYGMSREVYSSKVLPECVVKVEDGAGMFQNVVEWETWQRVKDTPASRWFAQCKWISPNGSVLVMERTKPGSMRDFPETMPVFLCDFKRSNYGMVGEFLVCHDYGTNLLFEHGMTKRTRKVEWYDYERV
ncbi:MAG: hypothetical protein H7255_20720 [Ramlibacter sp.]|nr:hypothetical protein [Ramlibacter sp.]